MEGTSGEGAFTFMRKRCGSDAVAVAVHPVWNLGIENSKELLEHQKTVEIGDNNVDSGH